MSQDAEFSSSASDRANAIANDPVAVHRSALHLAHEDGRFSHSQGHSMQSSPFEQESLLWRAWVCGWMAAEYSSLVAAAAEGPGDRETVMG